MASVMGLRLRCLAPCSAGPWVPPWRAPRPARGSAVRLARAAYSALLVPVQVRAPVRTRVPKRIRAPVRVRIQVRIQVPVRAPALALAPVQPAASSARLRAARPAAAQLVLVLVRQLRL